MYYLYKLKFPYGVHFGADKTGIGLEKIAQNCHCDTLYSALCHEILKLEGEKKLEEFVMATKNGEYLFSDLLPYIENDLLIPKPVLYKERSEEKSTEKSGLKKKMKKLQFISITKVKEFFDGTVETENFASDMTIDKNSVARDGNPENNGLYSISITKFEDGCGLYFVSQIPEDKKEWFDKIMKSLSLSGLGGKRTSGYGRFEIIDDYDITGGIEDSEKTLAQMMNSKSEYYLSLSAFIPQNDEIEKLNQGFYTLIKRNGFVASTTYSDKLLKKTPMTMINAGSCFKTKFKGDVADVSNEGNHPVYRYGKPIMIGIDL